MKNLPKMFWFGAACGLAMMLLVAGTQNTIVKWGSGDTLGDSGIVQPSTGIYEFGPMDWGTVIMRVPDNTNTTGNGYGTHLMILAGNPGQAVALPGVSDANGGEIVLKAGNGVGTNGYGGSIGIFGGAASGTGVPGSILLKAPTLYLSVNQFVLTTVTNAPADKNHVAKWVAVQIEGDTNEYRWPLYK